MPTSATDRIDERGISLPDVAAPVGNYVPAVRTGNLLYISGQVARTDSGELIPGQVGDEVTPEDARELARNAGLFLVAVAREVLGDLDRVARVVKLNGYVNAVPGFGGQPGVIDGCSDMLVEVFGERGRHARSALGVGSLPGNAPVEVEVVFEVTADGD